MCSSITFTASSTSWPVRSGCLFAMRPISSDFVIGPLSHGRPPHEASIRSRRDSDGHGGSRRGRSPNFPILETIRSGFHDTTLCKPLRWEKGNLVAPDEPGPGIEFDEQAVLDYPYTTGGRLHLDMCRTPLGSNNSKIITELEA